MGLKIVVGGSRYLASREFVFSALDAIHEHTPIRRLAHGACSGADTIAAEWAKERGVDVMPYPADWPTHGRRAGPMRNGRMLREERPDVVVAFPGGTGTADLVKQAKRFNIRVVEIATMLDYRIDDNS